MASEIIVNAGKEETRVALLENGLVTEIYIDRQEDRGVGGKVYQGKVMKDLPGSPSYSTVRTQLRVLEGKGHVRHEEKGLRFIYMPTLPRHAARRSALKHLADTFFDGSSAKVVAALLGGEAARLTDDELERIAELVTRARRER